MLKLRFIAVLFSTLLFVACDPEQKDAINVEIDTTDPVLTVSGFEPTIEKATTINISITDNSAISSKISVNGNEVFSSAEKAFSFEFDPFEYPSGANTATIVVTDAEDNSAEQTIQFDVKKLLYRLTSGFSSESIESYVAINLLESGALIANKKINSIEDADFYADDDFVKQDLIVTHYSLSKNTGFHLARSYAPIAPGTERLTYNEVLSTLGLARMPANQNSQFNISIQDTPGFFLYQLLGYDYSFGNSTEPNLEINYDSGFTSDVFLYHHSGDNANLLTDYKYLYTEDFSDKDLNFDELTSLTDEQITTIDLPADVTKVSLALLGYNSEEDFVNGYFRLLYNYGSDTADTGFSLNSPKIGQYAIVEKTLNLDLIDGRKVRLERDDISNFQIPDLTIQQNDRIIDINGNYDFSSLELTLNNNNAGADNAIFRRIYQSTFSETLAIPFEKIEIPTEITAFLTSKGFSITTNDTSGEMVLSLREYENEINLPNKEFYYVIGNETGEATEVTFPLEN